MSFVFISHASQDKPRVKPVVDALLSVGIKVFLDAPDAAGYSAADLPRFLRLHGGKDTYPAQLRTAVKEAGCVLVCWSVQATKAGVIDGTERHTWMAEIARADEKAVHCLLDGTSIGELPTQYNLDQIIRVAQGAENYTATLAKLVDDVQLKINETSNEALRNRNKLEALKVSPRLRGNLALPLLANRDRQANDFYSAISAAAGDGGVHPIVIKGPKNELPDAFLDRMKRTNGHLGRNGEAWHDISFAWPRESADARDFANAYRKALWRELRLSGRADNVGIAERLENLDLATVRHRIDAKLWRRREEPDLIRAWLDFWHELASQGRKIKVVPVLVIPLPNASPGWRDCPNMGSGGRVGVRDIWKSMRRFADGQTAARSAVQLTLPPVLGPISKDHSEDWLREELAEFDADRRSKIDAELTKMFARGRAKKHGVSHEEFNTRLAPLCAGAS